ncbi:hypothetical protein RJT34_32686 [Clitoria ternatea]|uniref:Uncharacterized protein n=1 Tax=Clitoria ternatea TaxID=43366 RepID=A0AAN9EYK7_CLITE
MELILAFWDEEGLSLVLPDSAKVHLYNMWGLVPKEKGKAFRLDRGIGLGSVWFPVGETELGKWRNLRVDIDSSRRSR